MVVTRNKSGYKSTRYSKNTGVSHYSEDGPLHTEKDSVRGSKRKIIKNQANSGLQQEQKTSMGFNYPVQKEMGLKDMGLNTKEQNMASFSPNLIRPNQTMKGKNAISKGKATHNVSKNVVRTSRSNS